MRLGMGGNGKREKTFSSEKLESSLTGLGEGIWNVECSLFPYQATKI